MSETTSSQVMQATFAGRARSMPTGLRRAWRLPLILELVDSCRSHEATELQIHLLSRLLLRSATRERLQLVVDNGLSVDNAIVRFEPALQRGLDLLVGSGHLERTSTGRFRTTTAGRKVLAEIRDTDAFAEERAAISTQNRKFTHTDALRILDTSILGLA